MKVATKYRMGYVYLLHLSGDLDKTVPYKGENVAAADVQLEFSVFNYRGEEVYFEADELGERYLRLLDGRSYPLSFLVNCSFDREKILDIKINPKFASLIEATGLTIKWEAIGYFFDVKKTKYNLTPMEVTKDEFMSLLKENAESFDNSVNHPAQTVEYFTIEID